jgi:hypothetical protein
MGSSLCSNLFIIIAVCFCNTSLVDSETYNGGSPRFALNDHLAILAQNENGGFFSIITDPYNISISKACTINYFDIKMTSNSSTDFLKHVDLITIGIKQNESHSVFTYLGTTNRDRYFLTVVRLQRIYNRCVQFDQILVQHSIPLSAQNSAKIAMDPYGTRVYFVTGQNKIMCLDIATKLVSEEDLTVLFKIRAPLYTGRIVVTADHHLFMVALFDSVPCIVSVVYVNRSSVTPIALDELSTVEYKSEGYDFSLAVHEENETLLIIVGLWQKEDEVIIMFYNKTSRKGKFTKKHRAPRGVYSFGKSVAMLDSDTYAVIDRLTTDDVFEIIWTVRVS